MTPKKLAFAMMVLATLLAGMDAVIVRLLAKEVHPLIIGLFRGGFGLMIVLPWIVAKVDLRASPYRALHVLRAGVKLAALLCGFVAYAHAPLADVTAISFTMPIFLTIGAWLFLNEQIGLPRVLGIAAGFVGIVIIIRPGAMAFDPWLLPALAGAVLTAVIQLMLRRMAQRDTTDRLVAWNLLAMVPLAMVIALPVWETPSLGQLGLLALQGVLGAVSMTLITRAYAIAEASFLAPLDFLKLPVVAMLALLFFAEVAPLTTWIGAALVFAATLLAAGGERFNRKRIDDGP